MSTVQIIHGNPKHVILNGNSSFSDLIKFPHECDGKHFFVVYLLDGYKYTNAVKQCARSGGRLLRIKTKGMEDCVIKESSKETAIGTNYWVGLRRIGEGRNDFIWSDGSALEDEDFINWGMCAIFEIRNHFYQKYLKKHPWFQIRVMVLGLYIEFRLEFFGVTTQKGHWLDTPETVVRMKMNRGVDTIVKRQAPLQKLMK